MNMKNLLNKMTQLEASVTKAAPQTAPKKKLLKESASAGIRHETSLTNLFNQLHEAMAPGQKPMPVVGKQGDTQKTGTGFLNITDPSPTGQAMQKALGDLAAQGKAQIVMPAASGQPQQNPLQPMQASNQPNQTMQEDDLDEANTGDEAEKKFNKYNAKELEHMLKRASGNAERGDAHKQNRARQAKDAAYNIMFRKKYKGDLDEGAKVDRMVKHIEKSEKKSGKSKKEAENIAWATANERGMLDKKNKKKVKEADIPSSQGIDNSSPLSGSPRSMTALEARSKPDFLDLDKDGDKKEPMKKAAADKKKKAVKENMSHRMQAARLEGKAHGLKGHAHNGKHYDDMEESRAYHEGYKEGLDECYGMAPIVGLKREARMPVSTRAMAQNSLENTPLDEMEDHEIDDYSPHERYRADRDEENFLPKSRKIKPRDLLNRHDPYEFERRLAIGARPDAAFAFEALDRQLNRLLSENEETCNECGGMMEAEHSCGGKQVVDEEESEEKMEFEVAEANAVDNRYAGAKTASDKLASEALEPWMGKNVEVPAFLRKEKHDKYMQDTFPPALRRVKNEPKEKENDVKDKDVKESFVNLYKKLAMLSEEADQLQAQNFYESEKITEWANDAGKNGTKTTFEQDIDFMTNIISGGLNKQKSTGQATVPVVASQNDRIGYSKINESINDLKRLSGLNEGKNFLREDANSVSTILANIVNALGLKDQVLPVLAARLQGQSSTVNEQQLDERRGKVDMIVGAILGLAIAIGGNAALKIVQALGGSGYVQPHERVYVPTGSSVTGERYDYYTSDEIRESKRMKAITEGAGNAALAVIQLLVDLVAMIGAEEKFINAAQSANEEVLAEGDRRSIVKALLALIFAFGLSVAAGVFERLSGGSGEFDIPAFGPNGEVVGMRSGKIHDPGDY